jgi:hypothetical protein
MKKAYVSITMLLLMLTFIHAEIKTADVTGDGIEDEIKIGERIVIVIDGASGKRWEIWKGAKEENYEENVNECAIIEFADNNGLKISTSWYGTVRGGDLGSSIYYYEERKWHEMQDKYSKEEYEVKVDAGSSEIVEFELSYGELLIVDEITYEGAGGAIVLIDYGIKVNVYSSEGDEYYSSVLAETGEGLSDWVVELRGIGDDPLTVFISFDNSEASSAYRKVSYSATVYSTE